MNLNKSLESIEPFALEAGSILLTYLTGNKNIVYKGDVDLVTDGDKASEKFLVTKLSEVFPEVGIIAEEGARYPTSNGYNWVIDPLDGTTSFAHGFPFFAVSIGLVDAQNEPVAGVVYNPFFSEYFSASKGQGAYLNKQPIAVSSVESLSHALLGTGFPYDRRQRMDELMTRLARVLHKVHDIRRTGSAALDICYVAVGRTDGYFETGLKPWDTAAALVILHEAGGKSSQFSGVKSDIFKPEIAVSNGKFHEDLLELIN